MTALELARRGARVVLACRSRERGEAAAFDLRQVREGGGGWDREPRTNTPGHRGVSRLVSGDPDPESAVRLLKCGRGSAPWCSHTGKGQQTKTG